MLAVLYVRCVGPLNAFQVAYASDRWQAWPGADDPLLCNFIQPALRMPKFWALAQREQGVAFVLTLANPVELETAHASED